MSGTEPLRNALEVKMQKVTPADVAEGLTEFWSQQVIGSANGNLFKVARGVEHCPYAEEEAHFLLVGPEVTSNAAGGKPAWSYGQSGEAQPASG